MPRNAAWDSRSRVHWLQCVSFLHRVPASAPLRCESARLKRIPMQEINPINHLLKDLSERTDVLRGYL